MIRAQVLFQYVGEGGDIYVRWVVSREYANGWVSIQRDICHWGPSVDDRLLLGICE